MKDENDESSVIHVFTACKTTILTFLCSFKANYSMMTVDWFLDIFLSISADD